MKEGGKKEMYTISVVLHETLLMYVTLRLSQ